MIANLVLVPLLGVVNELMFSQTDLTILCNIYIGMVLNGLNGKVLEEY